MKSAPDWVTRRHMVIFSSWVSRQVSMMTFKILLPQSFFSSEISFKTAASFFSFRAPMWMTISISSAPFSNAFLVSKELNKGFCFSGVIAVWKADNRTDCHGIPGVFLCPFHKGRRNADGGSSAGDGVVAERFNVLPCGCLGEIGVINLG